MKALQVPRRQVNEGHLPKVVEKLFDPLPLPTHYITPFDMKGKWPRRKSKMQVGCEIMEGYNGKLIILDSMCMVESFSSVVKGPAGPPGRVTDPWYRYRPHQGGYYA